MSRIHRGALAFCAAGSLVALAGAQVITPIAATGFGDFGTSPTATIDGSGLVGTPGLGAFHDPTFPNNSWVVDPFFSGELTGVYELGGLYTVDGGFLWNQNNGGPDPLGATGVSGLDFFASTNGVDFAFVGSASFNQEFGDISFEQAFGLGAFDAAFIRVSSTANFGGVFGPGFAEIRFTGRLVPAPGAAALLGLSGVVVARRRRS